MAAALAPLGGGRMLADPSLASLAQRAERDYVGQDGAIISQLVSAGGRARRAMLLDCRSLDSRLVALPPGVSVVICRVGAAARDDAAIGRTRRAECGRAVLLLSERMPGLASLRDLDAASLRRHRRFLDEVLARRAEHVIGENARVLATATALESCDLDAICRLFAESHQSARSLYEIGSPALDVLVAIARNVRGVVAARMAGAGVGDCTVNLVLDEAVPALIDAVEREFKPRTGLEARVFPVTIVDGAGPVATEP
jgi:galactokinase